jgi:UDP-N-acetyl-D-glucosamine dehydrogenase
MIEPLLKKLKSKRAVVGVVGLGYVGLPLVHLFASKGFRVLGFDIDEAKTRKLNQGRSYILSIPSERTRDLVEQGRLEATSDLGRLSEPDALIICVPTPLTEDRRPDLSYIKKTGEAIGRRLRKGQLVCLESTTYPGTTREVLLPELATSKLRVGRDFFLAFSPEREDPGNKKFTQESIPKVVGGFDPQSHRAACALYGSVLQTVVPVSSCEVAESAKLLENIYRSVNIATINELKMLFDRMKIDIWEVIRAASTKPFGFQPFTPGPGWGGHCIPIDPFYLSWKAKEFNFNARFIELAGEVNTQMPFYVLSKLEDGLKQQKKSIKGARILVLGIAYKKDIDDPRESPAFPFIEILLEKGARVSYSDPLVPSLPRMRHYPGHDWKSVALSPESLKSFSAAVIITDHSAFDYAQIVKHSRLVIDTRNATRDVPHRASKVISA